MDIIKFSKILKNKNNQVFFIILIIGVVLILMSGSFDSAPDNSDNKSFSEEERLEHILSDIKGAGEVSVMITYYESEPGAKKEINKAKGAVVTAQGCFDPSIKNAISAAVCAALDLPAHKVCVYIKK